MDTNTSNGNEKTANKSKSKKLWIGIVAAIVIVIVAALFLANALIQSQPVANFEAKSWSIDQEATGATTFTMTVQNTGNNGGNAIMECGVFVPSSLGGSATEYNNTQTVYLTAGETQTLTITVDTPFGTTITKDMCVVNVNSA